MYLTRMELDITKRETIMALASPARFHGAVERAFEEKGGKLWRIDTLNGKWYLLVVSDLQPDLSSAVSQFGTVDGWKTLDYAPFLAKIRTGDRRCFLLKANPVITISAGSGNRGKVLAHVTAEQQTLWLLNRTEKYGFCLNPEDFRLLRTTWESFYKGGEKSKRVAFRTATFEGMLTVSDADLFRQTLQNGIGREKAYGCGLMTVTRRLYE